MAYSLPTAADLKAEYPAFASVDNTTIDKWIARVSGPGGDVDTGWSEDIYALAIEAAAAHRMALRGILGTASDQSASFAASGVTGFKSGTVDITIDASVAQRLSAGGWDSTPYGRDYLDYLRKRGHGAGVTNVGGPCCA